MERPTRPEPRNHEIDRVECENWFIEAKVIECITLDEIAQDVTAVEQFDAEEVLDTAEIVFDVVTSPLNPFAWLKLLVRGWRTWRKK